MQQANTLRSFSRYLEERGDYDKAERLLRKAVQLEDRDGDNQSESFATDLYDLGLLNLALDRYDKAHDYLIEALALRMVRHKAQHPEVMEVLEALAMASAEDEWYLTA